MKQSESNKDPLFKHFKELGIETPSDSMMRNVMQRVNIADQKLVYEPVISLMAMRMLIASIVAFCIAIVVFDPKSGASYFDFFGSISFTKFGDYLPRVRISTFPITINMSLLAFGLLSLIGLLFHQIQLKKLT